MRLLKEIRNLLDNYHVKSGIYHYYRGEFNPAVDFFRKALDSDDELTTSDRRIALYYLTMTLMESAARKQEKGELEDAADHYDSAVAASPDYPDIRLHYGALLERMNRDGEAVVQYRAAIASNDSYLDAWIALGFCLLRLKRSTEANEAFRHACEIKLAQTRDPFERGLEQLEADRYDDARLSFHEAFVYVPQLFEQRHRAALQRLKAEDYEGALEELDGAIALNPGYPDLFNFRGIALAELGRVEEGIEAFRWSSELNPRFMVPRLNLAFAMLRAGQVKEAEEEFEAILEDDPTEPAARSKLQELQSGIVPEKRRSGGRGVVR